MEEGQGGGEPGLAQSDIAEVGLESIDRGKGIVQGRAGGSFFGQSLQELPQAPSAWQIGEQ